VGRKLDAQDKRWGTATGIGPLRDSGPHPCLRPRYVCLCKVRIDHGNETYAVALWPNLDHLTTISVRDAQRAAGLTLDIVVVEANPWRALEVGDVADVWRLMPPGSVVRPIRCGRAATLLVECPDGTFSQVGASPIVGDIPGAMRLAYGDDAPAGTWTVKRPFHLR
jgi:hypothetical protein